MSSPYSMKSTGGDEGVFTMTLPPPLNTSGLPPLHQQVILDYLRTKLVQCQKGIGGTPEPGMKRCEYAIMVSHVEQQQLLQYTLDHLLEDWVEGRKIFINTLRVKYSGGGLLKLAYSMNYFM